MTYLQTSFWVALAFIVYTYALYPLLVAAAARLRRRAVRRDAPFTGSVSVILAVHNEEANIERRLGEFTDLVAASGREGEIVVVSDGSTDGTAVLAKAWTKGDVQVFDLPDNVGKAAALTQGCAAARHDILVFADARQTWAPDALETLLANFADPAVGAVSGDLMLEGSQGVLAGVGLYWRFEKWLRKNESRLHSVVGLTGAISAVRRPLFRPIPKRTLLDDVYWPMQVVLQGYRAVHEDRAKAFDRLPQQPRDEFCRKVRTLSGNLQLVSRLPAVLVPGRNPIWWQFVSHKLCRLLVPWAMLVLLVTNALLPEVGWRIFLELQLGGYALGLTGLWQGARSRSRLVAAAGSFLVLNAAAWLAFWVWVSGKAARSWHKTRYESVPAAPYQSAVSTT
jgi:poly-beta-1,6-N-acetyl-D-glucosamine synthase